MEALLVAGICFVGWSASSQAQEYRLESLRAAAEADRQDAEAQSAYGEALLLAGHFDEAERVLRTAARLGDNSAAAYYRAARAAFARGDYRASVAACRLVERGDRNGSWARACRARAFLVWNRSARAFDELEAVLEESSDHYEALVALGDAHRLRGEVPEAERAYTEAVTSIDDRPEAFLGLGQLYIAANRPEEAIRGLREARRRAPEWPVVAFELGMLLTGNERLELLREAVRGRPEWPIAQTALGEAELAAGSPDAARAAFERAVQLREDHAPAHVGLARAQLALGDHGAAQISIERALTLVPNSGLAVLTQARLYAAQRQNERAFEQYRRAGDLTPTDPTPLIEAAELALELRRDVLAVGYLDRVLDRHPRSGAALALYGDVMMARGNRDEARGYYQRALDEGEGNFDRDRVQRAVRSQ